MSVTLEYVTLDNFSDVMTERQQAEATGSATSDPNDKPIRDQKMTKRFLRRAESIADSYLILYDRPIEDVPMALEYAIYVIARYLLLERGDGSVSEDVQNSYDQAISWLKAIRDGEADLAPETEEDLTDFSGDADLSGLQFEEYPFVDKSTFATSSQPLS